MVSKVDVSFGSFDGSVEKLGKLKVCEEQKEFWAGIFDLWASLQSECESPLCFSSAINWWFI